VEDQPDHQQTTKKRQTISLLLDTSRPDFTTLKPTQMGLKIFPPHIFKNNFSQPHIGTFVKPHKPTHIPSFAKEPIPHPYKIFIALNINDVKYSLKKSQK
jgi:hypothetical protein